MEHRIGNSGCFEKLTLVCIENYELTETPTVENTVHFSA